jgi:IS30 family transposase
MVEWRRNKVQELLVQGHSQWDIADNLKVDQSTISRDIEYVRQQSRQKIRKYIDETLPEEYEKSLVGINSILKEAWNISNNTEANKREKIHALSLAKECYSMKLELLTNATVVNDAMKFVSSNNNKKSVSEEEGSSSQESKEQEPNYEEDKDRLEEKQEEEIGEIPTETINQVF